ncbi:hypothetical protein [Flavobacterium psychrotrophum]|uniref:hypothetical protein n=1 Tax=Flavobacterium psychrotrophum TaxID=2294119 RepID=UPI000E30EF3B|nr:hypothetical protein [Flavobacterium psychrotrophum]
MKHKIKLIHSVKIWVAIYPSITIFLYIFGPQIKMLPIYVQTFLLTILLVPFVVFAGIPLIDSALKLTQQK